MNNISKFAWPVVVLIVLVLFRGQIASQFDRLTKIETPGFSVVLRETATSQNNEGAYDIIEGLTREGIIALLDTGHKTMFLTYEDVDDSIKLLDEFDAFIELENNGLMDTNLQATSLEEFSKQTTSSNLQSELTTIGIEAITAELNTKGKMSWDIIAESVNTALNPKE